MRAIGLTLVLLLTLAYTGPSRAEGLNNLYAGINGLLTFPADPVMMVVTPPDQFEDLPAHQVTGRILALPAGALLSVFRLTMAATDLAFTPFWLFPVMSPQPRWEIIKGVEYE